MKDSMTALCLSLESGLAELVNSQDDWRLCALLSAARQGVAGVRRRAQDEAAGRAWEAAQEDEPGTAWGLHDVTVGAPSEPGGDCSTCGGTGKVHDDCDDRKLHAAGMCMSDPCPDCAAPGHIGPSSASNTPESKGVCNGNHAGGCADYPHVTACAARVVLERRALADACPECGAPCPPGLAMCVECQAREGRE